MIHVLFACVHNAGRSQIAAAFFNQLVDPAKAHAESAGTQPGEQVHTEVVAAMREVGIDLTGARPQRLTAELAQHSAWLITMGCGDECPVVPGAKREDWPIDDPANQPLERVRLIRADVAQRVRHLIQREGWN